MADDRQPAPEPEEEIMPDFLPVPEEMATPSEQETFSLMEQLLADYPDQRPPPPLPETTMLAPLPPQLDNYQPPPAQMMAPDPETAQLVHYFDGLQQPAPGTMLLPPLPQQQHQMAASSSSAPAGNNNEPWVFSLPAMAVHDNSMDLLNQPPPPANEHLDCRYCDVAVAELRHTNGRWDVRLSVHGAAGGAAFTHAVLRVAGAGGDEQPPMHIDLRGWAHEAVQRFVDSYNWRMTNSAAADGMPDQDVLNAFFLGGARHVALPGQAAMTMMGMPPPPPQAPAPAANNNAAVVVPPVVLESYVNQEHQQGGGADYDREEESRRIIRAAGEEAGREPWTPFPAAFGPFCRGKLDFNFMPARLRDINKGIMEAARKVATRRSSGKQLAEARALVEGLVRERAQIRADIEAAMDRERAGFVFPRARRTPRKNDHEASGSGSGGGAPPSMS